MPPSPRRRTRSKRRARLAASWASISVTAANPTFVAAVSDRQLVLVAPTFRSACADLKVSATTPIRRSETATPGGGPCGRPRATTRVAPTIDQRSVITEAQRRLEFTPAGRGSPEIISQLLVAWAPSSVHLAGWRTLRKPSLREILDPRQIVGQFGVVAASLSVSRRTIWRRKVAAS